MYLTTASILTTDYLTLQATFIIPCAGCGRPATDGCTLCDDCYITLAGWDDPFQPADHPFLGDLNSLFGPIADARLTDPDCL